MTVERRRFRVSGVVQGVGYRPFVYGLARRHSLGGFVLNDGAGVVVEAEGDGRALDAFAAGLKDEAPVLARGSRCRSRRPSRRSGQARSSPSKVSAATTWPATRATRTRSRGFARASTARTSRSR